MYGICNLKMLRPLGKACLSVKQGFRSARAGTDGSARTARGGLPLHGRDKDGWGN